jgi:putative Mn2+ efflux pump MntP
VGTYVIVAELVGERSKWANKREKVDPSIKRLVIMGAALSIDNLVIGFALGTSHTNFLIAAVTIGVVSVALSLVGLEIGSRLGGRLGQRSELVGGAVLILIGVAIGTGLL